MAVESVDPADCGGYYLHDAHSWREGFLYLRKRVCRGTASIRMPKSSGKTIAQIRDGLLGMPSSAQIPLTIIDHKHDFKLTSGFAVGTERFVPKLETDILWHCDWLDCEHYFVISRSLWKEQGVPYDTYGEK
jgi:hypothetical protein